MFGAIAGFPEGFETVNSKLRVKIKALSSKIEGVFYINLNKCNNMGIK